MKRKDSVLLIGNIGNITRKIYNVRIDGKMHTLVEFEYKWGDVFRSEMKDKSGKIVRESQVSFLQDSVRKKMESNNLKIEYSLVE